jgi:RHS repeat-associated protein
MAGVNTFKQSCNALARALGLLLVSALTLPVSAQAAVGRTAGSFSVSNSGAATYSIPIWEPPGVRGLQPALALTYDSQSGDGVVGPGWALSGFSAIARCNKTFAQDGVAAGVTLAYSDVFCLDGQKLRMTGGASYGQDATTYQTEIATFANVTAHGTTGNGPTYFTVQGKDGLIYEYGNSTDSRITPDSTVTTPYTWLLSRVKDRSGNSYTVAYGTGAAGSAGIGVPVSISYSNTSAGGASYSYTVTFSYTTKDAQAPGTHDSTIVEYLYGSQTTNTNLLVRIDVNYNGTLVHKYTLGYGTSPTTTRARLTSVTECASKAGTEDCLAPTMIGYQNGSAGVSVSGSTAAPASATFIAAADFNGDGRQDIVYGDTTGVNVALASGSGFGTPFNLGTASSSAGVVVGDAAGTGKADVLVPQNGSWVRYAWNGSGFTSSATGIAVPANFLKAALTDLNGDGRADFVAVTRTLATRVYTLKIFPYLNTSSGSAVSFATQTTYTRTVSCGSAGATTPCNADILTGHEFQSAVTSLDFNGDGNKDLALSTLIPNVSAGESFGALKFLLWNGTTFVDGGGITDWDGVVGFANWNNDACTDIILSSPAVAISPCNNQPSNTIALPSTPLSTIDWDGDGRTDVLVQYGTHFGVTLSTGTGFTAIADTGVPLSTSSASNVFVFDQNGDRLQELGTWGPAGLLFYPHASLGVVPDVVTSIVDGYGVTVSPSYVSLVLGNYTKGTGATYPEIDVEPALYVVSQYSATNGIGGTYTKTYSYAGARADAQRGFEGFQSITVSDSRSTTPVVQASFRTDFPYTGFVTGQNVYQHNGTTPISSTTNTPGVNPLNLTANQQRYFPYLAGSSTSNYEVGGLKNGALISQVAVSAVYDSYGNVTSLTRTVTDSDTTSPASVTVGQSWTTTVTNTISPQFSSDWCLSIPTQMKVERSGTYLATIARTTNFTPDYAKCRVSQQVVEPTTSYQVTTDYHYDDAGFGNLDIQTVTGINMPARATGIDWGITGQFPRTVTDALGQKSTAGYDYSLGVQTSITDPNGIGVSMTYDAFGRKTKDIAPDQTYTTYSYSDCSAAPGGCQNGDPGSGATGINKMVVVATQYDAADGALRDDSTYLDQFGRPIVSWSKLLDGSYSRVGTQYDELGRAYRQTVPCKAVGCAVYWVTNMYDALSRVSQSQRPISASDPTLQTTVITYLGLTTTVTDPYGKQTTKIVDPNGWLRRSSDHNGYYQNFGYDAFGSLTSVVDSSSPANALFSASYVYGVDAFQTATADMDRGTWGYTPNALGEVVAYTDAKQSAFSLTYDLLSRPLTRSVLGEATTARFTYGTDAAAYNIGRLVTTSVDGGPSETFTYDNKGRVTQREIVSDLTYDYNYAYSPTTGALDTLTYPTSTSGYRLKLQYAYAYGLLKSVTDYSAGSAGTAYWTGTTMNVRGQFTSEQLGNGIVTNRAFDAVTGFPQSVLSGPGGNSAIQNEAYLFDNVGNLTQRQDNNHGLTENFYYDNLYRLDHSALGGVTNLAMGYDAMGNITSRSDVAGGATWTYDPAKKHAVTQAGSSAFTYSYDSNGNAVTRNGFGLTWSKYNYPTVINGPNKQMTFAYDANNERYSQVYKNGSVTETTIYIGKLLTKVTDATGTGTDNTDWRHSIVANGQTIAIVSRQSSGTNAVHYLLEDHEGSVSHVTDSSGANYVSESFTAFGQRRDPGGWSASCNCVDLGKIASVTRFGYTGQEAIGGASMGLIHMNGRVQDAITGRFLSADPFVFEPGNTQGFNRYSYVMNNPLSYTDPSGYSPADLPRLDDWWQYIFYTHNNPYLSLWSNLGSLDDEVDRGDRTGNNCSFLNPCATTGIHSFLVCPSFDGLKGPCHWSRLDPYPGPSTNAIPATPETPKGPLGLPAGVKAAGPGVLALPRVAPLFGELLAMTGAQVAAVVAAPILLVVPRSAGSGSDFSVRAPTAQDADIVSALSVSAAKAKTQDRVPYVIRLQAQGGGTEKSVVLANVDPITGLEGTAGLAVLGAQLTKKELELRAASFIRAERYILGAARAGGIGPPGKSFPLPGSDIRIDVEILNGINFTQ